MQTGNAIADVYNLRVVDKCQHGRIEIPFWFRLISILAYRPCPMRLGPIKGPFREILMTVISTRVHHDPSFGYRNRSRFSFRLKFEHSKKKKTHTHHSMVCSRQRDSRRCTKTAQNFSSTRPLHIFN